MIQLQTVLAGTRVDYNKNGLKVRWEIKRNEKTLKRQDKWQVQFAFSSIQAMEKSKGR